ncbi:hypothetical protein tinsulaeT_07010 [Thalassotalea insulae]|uniref:F5/8 type C domain-containing protein n=1 Tax=Thalassotalea insulae TaxID=2056778 RepID=A0ABQ6GT77_9GAMM|nr:discoidin domain-containing protein [Thalassotalea insulae]GLX77361.1 hypothetical protein tinsulaeT_07010 [Thalassotalea insulae]
MKNAKFSLVAISTALMLGMLSGCGGSNDPKAESIPVTIKTTSAGITGNAIKGTLSYADVSVTALNGSQLTIIGGDAQTDAHGENYLEVQGEPGFGISSIVKVTITADNDSMMVCDSDNCGNTATGGTISGAAIAGTKLSTLAYLSVPYASRANGEAAANYHANVLTTFATKLIERDIAEGRNVSTLQLLELAQAEYSAIVLKALGINANNINVFNEQLVSAEDFNNFITDNVCEDVAIVDENDEPVLDDDGNATYEEQCHDVYVSDNTAFLSFINGAFSSFAEGYNQNASLFAAYANLEAALAGNPDALVALRQPLYNALNASPIVQGFGLTADDIMDIELALFDEQSSSGPMQEVTTSENMAGAIITARNRISDGESEMMAFDGDVNTKWLDHNDWGGAPSEENPSWLQVQFAEPHAVSSLFITSANDADNRDPENFNIVASNDGEHWVKLAEFIGESFDERFERKEFRFSNGLEYSYYRLNITKNKGDDTLMQLAEIAFVGPIYASADHTDAAGITVTARNRIGDAESEMMAFDNNAETKWLDHNDWAGAPTEEDPSWVQVDFAEAVAVNVLGLTSANDADNRDPENFNLQGSNDGGQTWTSLASWLGESFDERFERKLFNFGNSLAYSSYRLNITKNKGDDTLMQVGEIELIGPKLPDINHGMVAGVTVTARNRIGDGEAETKAFDGDINTKWLDHNDWAGAPTEEDPSWVQVQLPQAATVNKLALTSANDADNRDPENFNIEASHDGETWMPLASWLGESFDARFERKEFSFSNDLAFNYYRVNITKNKGDDTLMQVAEIELIGPQYSSIDHSSVPGVAITARNRIGDAESEEKVFDDDVNTKWLDHNDWAGAPTEENPAWVQVDLPAAKIVSSIAITSANDADNRDPENFNIQGSNDGGATWTTLSSWVGESWDNRFERKLFEMGNGFAFTSYRINITKNKGDDTLMQIAEIELIGPDL